MTRAGFVLVGVLAAAGCVTTPKQQSALAPPADGKQKVAVQAAVVGERGKAAVTPEAFAGRVGELLRDRRTLTATGYVERFPDVAVETLRAPPAGTPPDVLAFVERAHDTQCAAPGAARWEDRRRANTWAAAPPDADGLVKLCKAAAGTPGAVDAARVAGPLLLNANRPADAADALQPTAAVGERPYEAVDLSLLYAEALRRAGRVEQADKEWAAAAVKAANLPAVHDPGLWERIAAGRPVQAAWPASVRATLVKAAADFPPAERLPEDILVWVVVGSWRLDRNEPQLALTAFKRAETGTTDATARDLLRVWQAKALALADQVPTATAVLVPLVDHPMPTVAGPAAATLGAVKLKAGAAQHARALLEQALRQPGDWPGRGEAEADYALALFLDGDEKEGLVRLQAAEAAFRAAGNRAGLMRALRNEAEYWVSTGNTEQAEAIRSRVRSIEDRGTD